MKDDEKYEELFDGRVSCEVANRLARYAGLVEKWGRRHNLVKVSSRQELVDRHILEALAVCRFMNSEGRMLDVGSGAGFPGIPILCAQPGWSGVLLEPRQKRWAFLKMVVRELDLDAEVFCGRFEAFGPASVDLVTARALGGHEDLLSWAKPRLTDAGCVALWGTEDEENRLRSLSGWRVLSSPLIGLDRGRLIRFQECST